MTTCSAPTLVNKQTPRFSISSHFSPLSKYEIRQCGWAFDAARLGALAKGSRGPVQLRRLLSLAEIYDGGPRGDGARIGGVGLHRHWATPSYGILAMTPEGNRTGKVQESSSSRIRRMISTRSIAVIGAAGSGAQSGPRCGAQSLGLPDICADTFSFIRDPWRDQAEQSVRSCFAVLNGTSTTGPVRCGKPGAAQSARHERSNAHTPQPG